MLASIFSFTASAGYPVLFLLVMAESGGIPVPGETALIAAGAFAASGRLSLPLVIAVAAAAAIIGDNLGFLVARRVGPGLLRHPGPFARQRREAAEKGEPFFARHGPKAVFVGRWFLGLRTWTAWLAGSSGMSWPRFLFWNALGGISWATSVGLLAYFVGRSVSSAFTYFGLGGLVLVAIVGGVLLTRRRRHAVQPQESGANPYSGGGPST
jgi:membrane-associated protein